MAKSMIHCNGHIVAVVDTETSGLKPFFNDIIQVCVLPLDSNLEPLRGIVPFYVDIKPRRRNVDYKAMEISRSDYADICVKGLDADRAVDLFDEWYQKLPLPVGKKLMPLAHNWVYDYCFMLDWMGWEAMQGYFWGHYRDSMVAALYENDRQDFQVEQTPYPKVSLKYLCSQLKVENQRAHDALADCLATAQVYKKMLRSHIPPAIRDDPCS